jgi:hypothetical protein
LLTKIIKSYKKNITYKNLSFVKSSKSKTWDLGMKYVFLVLVWLMSAVTFPGASDDSLVFGDHLHHSVTAQGQQRYLCHRRNVLLLPGAGCLAVVEVTRSLLSAILICSLC